MQVRAQPFAFSNQRVGEHDSVKTGAPCTKRGEITERALVVGRWFDGQASAAAGPRTESERDSRVRFRAALDSAILCLTPLSCTSH